MRLGLIAILVLLSIATQGAAMGKDCYYWIDSTTIGSGQGLKQWVDFNTNGCSLPAPVFDYRNGTLTITIIEDSSKKVIYTKKEKTWSLDPTYVSRYYCEYIPYEDFDFTPRPDQKYVSITILTEHVSADGTVKTDKETRIYKP